MIASQQKDCPKCQAVGYLLSPLKEIEAKKAIYGCTACGTSFRDDGTIFVKDSDELRDVFKGGTMGSSLIDTFEKLSGAKFSPAVHAAMVSSLLEYGVQMWFDGMKQGVLLGAVRAHAKSTEGGVDGKVRC